MKIKNMFLANVPCSLKRTAVKGQKETLTFLLSAVGPGTLGLEHSRRKPQSMFASYPQNREFLVSIMRIIRGCLIETPYILIGVRLYSAV